jgi:hypothetical protein
VKKSKVDAIVRSKVAEAESRGISAGISKGRSEARKELELLLVPPDDGTGVCVIGGEPPKHGMIFVAIYPQQHLRLMANGGDLDFRDMQMQVQRAAFRPVQMCQSFQTGQRVVWYNYQFEGMR